MSRQFEIERELRQAVNPQIPSAPRAAQLDALMEGARELILAIFRQAVADYLGFEDREGSSRRRKIDRRRRREASEFLRSRHAEHLADLIGLSAAGIWSEAQRRDRLDGSNSITAPEVESRDAARGSGGTAAHRFPRSSSHQETSC